MKEYANNHLRRLNAFALALLVALVSSCGKIEPPGQDKAGETEEAGGTMQQAEKAAPDKFPEFFWDTIPRYMHVWKVTSYTDEELEYLAQFPLITFEKAQGGKEGSVQEGTLKAARAVKQLNPDANPARGRRWVVVGK